MGSESGWHWQKRGRNDCPWNQGEMGKKGHGYPTYRVKRPRDGCMVQNWWRWSLRREGNTGGKSLWGSGFILVIHTPLETFLSSTRVLSFSVTSPSSWIPEKQSPHSLRKKRWFRGTECKMGPLDRELEFRACWSWTPQHIVFHWALSPIAVLISALTQSHTLLVIGIGFEVRSISVWILVLNSVVQGN